MYYLFKHLTLGSKLTNLIPMLSWGKLCKWFTENGCHHLR